MRARLDGTEPHVIGADGGAAFALDLGLTPDTVVGDMDSLSQASRTVLEKAGCSFKIYPVEKDLTDSHLALELAYGMGFRDITVVVDSHGRLDHVLGLLWAASGFVRRGSSIRLLDAGIEAVIVDGPAAVLVDGPAGLTVSLLPLHGSVKRITLDGMKYPLIEATLGTDETRGVSNETLTGRAGIRFEDGILLVIATDHCHEDESSHACAAKSALR